MGIWILHQDGDHLIEVSEVGIPTRVFKDGTLSAQVIVANLRPRLTVFPFRHCFDHVELGVYASRERCVEIIKEISEYISSPGSDRKPYEMPKE
jgi:hypothetical protein